MSQSQDIESYPDARTFMDRVLSTERGGMLIFKSYKPAFSFSQRCYTLRRLELKRNLKLYSEGDPLYGTSVYHVIVLKVLEMPDGERWCVRAIIDAELALQGLNAEWQEL